MNTGRLHAILVCILLALPPTIRAHYHRTTPVVRPQDVDLKRIFREITTTPAADLFTAAGQVYRDGKLEDAAFLFYVAQLRVAHDMLMYPARGTGGNSPFVAFGAIASVLGPEINGALSSQPTIQHAALLRVRKWAPAVHRTYSPGWEYTERQPSASVLPAYRMHADTFMTAMMGSCTLMLDPPFFEAFHYLKDTCIRRDADAAACDERRETMKRIAKEKELEDLLPYMLGG